ncbi:MAG: hypothetical protein RR374_05260 [Clostridia bacterium]
MSGILKFKQQAESYIKIANQKASVGNYSDAIRLCKRAIEQSDNKKNDYAVTLAQFYKQIGNTTLANNVLFEIISKNKTLSKEFETNLFMNLAQNYTDDNKPEIASYYLAKYMNEISNYSDIEISVEEKDFCLTIDDFRVLKKDDEKVFYLNYANALMESQQYANAVELYKFVSIKSELRVEDYANLAFALYKLSVNDEALNYVNKIIEIAPTNIFVWSKLFSVTKGLQAYKQEEIIKNVLLNAKPANLDEVLELCNCFNECFLYDKAIELLLPQIKDNPYDIELNTYLAILYYNKGEDKKAIAIARQQLAMYGDYAPAYFYLKAFKIKEENGYKKQLCLFEDYGIPEDIAQENLDFIHNAVAKKIDIANELAQDCDTKMIVTWFFGTQKYHEAQELCSYLIKSYDKTQEFLKSMLTKYTYIDKVMQLILIKAIFGYNIKQTLNVVVDSALIKIAPKISDNFEELPKVFKSAYIIAIANASLTSLEFEEKLFNVFNKVVLATKDTQNTFKNENALAGVLLFKLAKNDIFKDIDAICSIMDINKKTFNSYLERIDGI